MSNENSARKRRLAENLANHRAFVDEGDDPHEGDRADAGRVGLSHRAGGPQPLFHRREKDVQGQVLDGGVSLQEVAQPFA